MALAAREGLEGPGQAELLDRLEEAYPNMRAALEFAWHQAERDSACLGEGLRLAAALNLLWQRRGPLAEGVLQLDRLLALDDAQQRPSPPQVRASAVLAACALACFKGDYARTAELARHGIELCAPLGDHQGLALAHRFLGEVALGVGDHAAAEPHFERELAEASQAGDVSWQAHAYNMLGQTARLQGEFRRASSLLWQALKLFRAAGEPDGVSVILSSLGEVARDAGRPVQARRLFGAALRRHAAVVEQAPHGLRTRRICRRRGPGARRAAGPGVSRRGAGAPGGNRWPVAARGAGHSRPDSRAGRGRALGHGNARRR